jgi:hypothetical protein
MKRSFRLGLAALALILAPARLPAGGPAEDAASPLAQIPAKAAAVVQIRGFEQTKDRLIVMIKEALPDLGGKAEQFINNSVTQGLEGRSLKGLVKNGPIFVVFTELPASGDEEDLKKKVAVLARVTKYTDFRDGILTADERKELKKESGYEKTQIHGEDAYFVDRGDWVVVAQSPEAAKAFKSKPAQGLDSKLAKDLSAKLVESDVAAYIDMAAVRAQFGDQIANAKKEIENNIGDGADIPGLDKGQVEVIKKLIGPAFQAIDDCQAVLVAVDLRKPGLALHIQGSVGAGTKTNDLLKGMKPSALDELGRLPAGLMNYSAMQLQEGWVKDLGSYLYGANSGDKDKENKKLKAAMEEIAAAKPRFRLEGSAIPLKSVQVWTYDDPVKAVAAQLKVVHALEAGDVFQMAPIKEPKVKEKAEKHGDFTLHAFSATWDWEKLQDTVENAGGPAELAKKMPTLMKKWYGDDIHVWFGTDGKSVVQVIAKNFKEAQALLDQYTKGQKTIGEDSAFKEARKQLPKESSIVGLTDVPAYSKMMVDMFQAMMPLPIPLAAPAKGKTSYAGAAVTIKAERAAIDLWIPGTAAQEIYKIVEPVIKMFGGVFGGDAS